ncbi:MAG: cell division protein FtsQ/DivIB [Patescibacteria group bacterium]|nr:cell division protein FtsQ/DivIB [Patescibacteria group bacterium]MDD4610334.1 cell division protein FtsQ/DivIB [Patescibacteria group bacterium]
MFQRGNNFKEKKFFTQSGRVNKRGKRFENPFFHNKKTKFASSLPKFSVKIKLIFFLILLLAIFIFYFLFFSNFLSIKSISINNSLLRVNSDEILNIAWSQVGERRYAIMPQDNIFVFNTNKLANDLAAQYNFKNVSAHKNLIKRSIVIKVEEKIIILIWNEGDKYYNIDSEGNIINEINSLEIKVGEYPIVYNQGGSKINNNKIDLNNTDIVAITYLFNEFQKINPINETIEKFIIDQNVNTVKIKINNGPEIYFNSQEDIKSQLDRLVILRKEKLENNFKNLKYIDLRFKERVYYR